MCCPSATFAAWASAWLHGVAASDDALDALHAWGSEHHVFAENPEVATVFQLPEPGVPGASPARLLAALRGLRVSAAVLVLPVPGDVRGLGGGGPFTVAALRAGEAVLLPDAGYGVVAEPVAEGLMRWTVYPVPPQPVREHEDLAGAEHGLTSAIRDCAGALQELQVARERPGVREELSARLRARPRPDWPAGTPPRALRVLQRAEEVAAILAVAEEDEPGGAVSASAASARATALRPLSDAVRAARTAAVNETTRAFAGR